MRRSRATSTRSGEAGVGLLSSIVGVTVFLVLLLFAVQLALNLYATSAVTAVAYDAANDVATGTDVARAEQRAREVLERFEDGGGTLRFGWDLTRDDVVVLHVLAERPPLLARVRFPFQLVDRTVRVRWERFR